MKSRNEEGQVRPIIWVPSLLWIGYKVTHTRDHPVGMPRQSHGTRRPIHGMRRRGTGKEEEVQAQEGVRQVRRQDLEGRV